MASNILRRRASKVRTPTKTTYYVDLKLKLRVEMNDSPTFETGAGEVCPTDEARMAAFSSLQCNQIPGFLSVQWLDSTPLPGTTRKRR